MAAVLAGRASIRSRRFRANTARRDGLARTLPPAHGWKAIQIATKMPKSIGLHHQSPMFDPRPLIAEEQTAAKQGGGQDRQEKTEGEATTASNRHGIIAEGTNPAAIAIPNAMCSHGNIRLPSGVRGSIAPRGG